MLVNRVYVNTYKYDFHFAKICIASIRFWYPDIPIYLIKEYMAGDFDTSFVEKIWNVQILKIPRKKFGWGYGKLEPLFLKEQESFLVLDSDTVMTGAILDAVRNIDTQFIVDKEVQPSWRFNQIYYNLNRIRELEEEFDYPGYSFNSGQWFGTSGIVGRIDFSKSLEWSEPPRPKYPEIVFNGDQAHLNFVLHWLEQQGKVSIAKIKLMIWPDSGKAEFIDLSMLMKRKTDYPYIIHWAGMKSNKFNDLPRKDIISFYRDYYYSKAGNLRYLIDQIEYYFLNRKRIFVLFLKKVLTKLRAS